jgi:hypothetical protein
MKKVIFYRETFRPLVHILAVFTESYSKDSKMFRAYSDFSGSTSVHADYVKTLEQATHSEYAVLQDRLLDKAYELIIMNDAPMPKLPPRPEPTFEPCRKVFKGKLVANVLDVKADTEVYCTLVKDSLDKVQGLKYVTAFIWVDEKDDHLGYARHSSQGVPVTITEETDIDPTYFKQIYRLLLLESEIPLAGLINPDQFQLLESQVMW